MPIIPEILRERKNEWHFSAAEPWKPEADDGASDEVQQAIYDFLSESE